MIATLLFAAAALGMARRHRDAQRAARTHVAISVAGLLVAFSLLRGLQEMALFAVAVFVFCSLYRRWYRAPRAQGAAPASALAEPEAQVRRADDREQVPAAALPGAAGPGAAEAVAPVDPSATSARSAGQPRMLDSQPAQTAEPDEVAAVVTASAEGLEARQWRVLGNSGYRATRADAYPSPYATADSAAAEDAALAEMGIY